MVTTRVTRVTQKINLLRCEIKIQQAERSQWMLSQTMDILVDTVERHF